MSALVKRENFAQILFFAHFWQNKIQKYFKSSKMTAIKSIS